ncbi:YbhB/YbcL family Raf kinase inhibitor-like protein [soil metagenome]
MTSQILLARVLVCSIFATALTFTGTNQLPASAGNERSDAKGEQVESLKVSTSAFASGAAIPTKYTADGEDIAPSLSWSAAPAKTKSIAICVVDTDAPRGDWWHWVLYGLDAKTTELKEGTPKTASAVGASQGKNDFDKTGYNGPAPPKGKVHHYYFRVFALDKVLSEKPGIDKAAFDKAIAGHVIAKGETVGTYIRP